MKLFTRFLILVFFITVLSGSALAQQLLERINPVVWKTPYNEFSSGNFYIDIQGTRYYGVEPVSVSSDPGLERTTLEMIWREYGKEMRMFMYFRTRDQGEWEMYDLRTYNLQGNDWIYYNTTDTLGNEVRSLKGQRHYTAERTFSSKDGTAHIYCGNCSITAFIQPGGPPSVYGYSIDFRIGLPAGETITVSTDPMTGYGVNAVLFDERGAVVINQSDFTYRWRAENEGILELTSQSVPYPDGNCAYGILAPCPNFNVQIRGISPGLTRVLLDVQRRSDNTVVASNAFSVKVISHLAVPTNTPAPTRPPIRLSMVPTRVPTATLTPTPTPLPSSNTEAELRELRGEVGRLSDTVARQQKELTGIRGILRNIQNFLRSLFRW